MGRSRAALRTKVRANPKKSASLLALLLAYLAFIAWFRLEPAPLSPRLGVPVVREVTGLYPVEVEGVVHPRDTAELQRLVRTLEGPLSIGGGRFSMGGQTAAEGATQIDMRGMDDVLSLDPGARTVHVEAGITWRALQEHLDRHDLSVRIMQTYSNFTVGGSLSVNVHGRYVGEGPIVRSVRDVDVVLADGTRMHASRDENPELFFGAIGGYGGLGVIAEATLELAPNTRIERVARSMPVERYARYFRDHVRNDHDAVFHNGDLYPPDYDTVDAITWRETSRPLTVDERLQPRRTSTFGERLRLYLDTVSDLGKRFRARVWSPIELRRRPVVLRNQEASYDAHELDAFPAARADSAYVLQEFFIPVEAFDTYVPRLRAALRESGINALNLSIRHAFADPGTTLAWARGETFCFVLYYEQGRTAEARSRIARTTRRLIDATLAVGGRYYLPYQPHATEAQLRRAYPDWDAFVALRRRFDPTHRFRNRLLDRYDPPTDDAHRARAALHADARALRNEEQTLLTVPEWYIVFAAEEYASHLRRAPPSSFPYLGQIAQFWQAYRRVAHRTEGVYPWNDEYHTMIRVIGTSFSAENLIKALYENTVGRLTEAFAGRADGAVDTAADRFAAEVAARYDAFIRVRPWYEFPFSTMCKRLWALDTNRDSSRVRGAERLFALSVEYGVKTLYARLIGAASRGAYGVEESTTTVLMRPGADGAMPVGARPLHAFGEERVAIFPRYEAFGRTALDLLRRGGSLREIAGNPRVAFTVIAPRGRIRAARDRECVARWPVLTRPTEERVLLLVRVRDLLPILGELETRGARLDHVFDH